MSKANVGRKDLYWGTLGILGFAVFLQSVFPVPAKQASGSAVLWGLWGLILGVVTYVLIYQVTARSAFLRKRILSDLAGLVAVARKLSYAEIVLIAFIAGVGEELLFRVVLQGHLVDWFNPIIGIVLASVLFGLVHFISPVYVILTTLFGLFFGVVYHLTGSYILVAVWHFMYDVFAIGAIKHLPGFYVELNFKEVDESKIDL